MSAPTIGPQALRLFAYASARGDWTVRGACEQLATSVEEVEQARRQLLGLGLLVETPRGTGAADGTETADEYTARATAPEAALLRLLTAEEEAAAELTEQIRRTRERIGAVREVFLPLHTARGTGPGAEVVTGRANIARVLGDLADVATSEILSTHPGAVLPPAALAEGLERDLRVLGRGVSVRSIHLRPMTRITHGTTHLQRLRDAGAQVRIASILPFRFVLVDRVQALVPAPQSDSGDAMTVLRGEAVTALLVKVFEMCWASAAPLETTPSGRETGLSAQQQWVLRLMSTGRKDEAIARELGLSVRTLRRVMADLMTRLGVDSRFQAGVAAVKMGLLD
ncbi:helix-turn-helix transcriptional regulator [Streptomyces anandii]|uniref:LuxR C-terminal-related transcriptional regulator n=1 Tax=Streptomyces anandii TaxID=285454 RepID=A0ABW6HHK6_9ACTN